MTDDTLTAAVARLRDDSTNALDGYVARVLASDIRTVLAALEAAQADARRGKALADALRETYYCECCDKAPAKPVQIALAAIDAAMKGEGDA